MCVHVVDILRVPSLNPAELYSTKETLSTSGYARDCANSSGDIIELWFQIGMILPARGHLTMFGNIFGCHNRGEGCYRHLVSRGQRHC